MTDLLKNYNTQNRPVINESSPIVITFGVTLQQIVDLVGIAVVTITTSNLFLQDEKNQLLTTCMWFNLDWSDYQVFPQYQLSIINKLDTTAIDKLGVRACEDDFSTKLYVSDTDTVAKF